ncbi:MAG: FAD-binding oxidoreductase [Solirubrobacterales bacterium]
MSTVDAQNTALVDRLTDLVGAADVITDAAVRSRFETDWTGRWKGEAIAVVRPADADQVEAVLRACRDHGAAVITQGGNTGLVGGSVPRAGGAPQIVLSTSRLDRVDPPDPATGHLRIGAGATLAALQARAREQGWDAGLDLGARDSATVGGLVACDAGGARAIRYGTARARVAGLSAVLAEGGRVDRMNGLLKDNAGFDLAALLTGSEGTLGVITEVLWRLVPPPGELTAALVPLDSAKTGIELAGILRSRVRTLEAVELMSEVSFELALAYLDATSPIPSTPFSMLVECEADDDSMGALADCLDRLGLGERAAIAVDPAGRERLRRIREAVPEAIAADGVSHKFDIGVPAAALPRFLERLGPLVQEVAPGARLLYFGHLGDGNLHVNVLGPDPEDEAIDKAVLTWVADCGGTISAEHGVGVHKAAYLSLVRSPAEIEAMWAIKRALDPHLLLNPGALLEVR